MQSRFICYPQLQELGKLILNLQASKCTKGFCLGKNKQKRNRDNEETNRYITVFMPGFCVRALISTVNTLILYESYLPSNVFKIFTRIWQIRLLILIKYVEILDLTSDHCLHVFKMHLLNS